MQQRHHHHRTTTRQINCFSNMQSHMQMNYQSMQKEFDDVIVGAQHEQQ
jgi:hypothetical protein